MKPLFWQTEQPDPLSDPTTLRLDLYGQEGGTSIDLQNWQTLPTNQITIDLPPNYQIHLLQQERRVACYPKFLPSRHDPHRFFRIQWTVSIGQAAPNHFVRRLSFMGGWEEPYPFYRPESLIADTPAHWFWAPEEPLTFWWNGQRFRPWDHRSPGRRVLVAPAYDPESNQVLVGVYPSSAKAVRFARWFYLRRSD